MNCQADTYTLDGKFYLISVAPVTSVCFKPVVVFFDVDAAGLLLLWSKLLSFQCQQKHLHCTVYPKS